VLYRTLQERKCSLAIAPFRGKDLEHFAFVIDGPPEAMHLAIDPDENLVQMPAPTGIQTLMNPPLPDLGGEYPSEPVPPETDCLVTDVDAPFEKDVLNLAQ